LSLIRINNSFNTEILKWIITPSIRCSDPLKLVDPQWKWSWANWYFDGRPPPEIWNTIDIFFSFFLSFFQKIYFICLSFSPLAAFSALRVRGSILLRVQCLKLFPLSGTFRSSRKRGDRSWRAWRCRRYSECRSETEIVRSCIRQAKRPDLKSKKKNYFANVARSVVWFTSKFFSNASEKNKMFRIIIFSRQTGKQYIISDSAIYAKTKNLSEVFLNENDFSFKIATQMIPVFLSEKYIFGSGYLND
jgi:hypothetical protein